MKKKSRTSNHEDRENTCIAVEQYESRLLSMQNKTDFKIAMYSYKKSYIYDLSHKKFHSTLENLQKLDHS